MILIRCNTIAQLRVCVHLKKLQVVNTCVREHCITRAQMRSQYFGPKRVFGVVNRFLTSVNEFSESAPTFQLIILLTSSKKMCAL